MTQNINTEIHFLTYQLTLLIPISNSIKPNIHCMTFCRGTVIGMTCIMATQEFDTKHFKKTTRGGKIEPKLLQWTLVRVSLHILNHPDMDDDENSTETKSLNQLSVLVKAEGDTAWLNSTQMSLLSRVAQSFSLLKPWFKCEHSTCDTLTSIHGM